MNLKFENMYILIIFCQSAILIDNLLIRCAFFAICGFVTMLLLSVFLLLPAGKFEEAYNAYTAALHWLAPDDTQKSHILVALASLQYKFQNCEEAKKLLFQG